MPSIPTTKDQIFVQRGSRRLRVDSLQPHLHTSLLTGHRMDIDRMTAEDRAGCTWIGYGIGKGVTHPRQNISVFAIPEQLICGLHGELIQGFETVPVDPTPLCYETVADPGFGGFVRWVLFADPTGRRHVLGIDFSLLLSKQAGVANSMLMVADTIHALRRHGIPANAEVALLNCRMCEPAELTSWRHSNALVTVDDWTRHALKRLLPNGEHCPRCGLMTLKDPDLTFCFRCGCKPLLVWNHHLNLR